MRTLRQRDPAKNRLVRQVFQSTTPARRESGILGLYQAAMPSGGADMHHFLWHLDASYHVTIVLHSEIPRAIHISLIFCHGILGGSSKGLTS